MWLISLLETDFGYIYNVEGKRVLFLKPYVSRKAIVKVDTLEDLRKNLLDDWKGYILKSRK